MEEIANGCTSWPLHAESKMHRIRINKYAEAIFILVIEPSKGLLCFHLMNVRQGLEVDIFYFQKIIVLFSTIIPPLTLL